MIAAAARQVSHVALGVGRGEGPLAMILLRALGQSFELNWVTR